ncbi:MAG: hypothetical protein KBE04_12740 [Phycisphaerae bacterium]|nr:hypothetical protein [Phycisphaerae bacterium]
MAKATATAGVSRRQMDRWLDDDDFQRRLRRARDRVFGHALCRLCNLASKAVEVLALGLEGDPSVDRMRLWSAKAVLENAQLARADELAELQNRLEAVLARMENG